MTRRTARSGANRPRTAARIADLHGDPALRGAAVSIGAFDGVHLGHRALLGRMRERSRNDGVPAVIVTFFPPAKVVFQGSAYLSSAAEKLELLAEYAPDAVVVVPFDEEYARTAKSEFVAALAGLEPSSVIVGEDFRFGHRRAGGTDDLRAPGRDVEVFGLVEHGGDPVKSTRIRDRLAVGDIDAANALLGAPYRARGPVVEGDRRGRTIGYPTANVELDPRKALPIGVFAVEVDVGVDVAVEVGGELEVDGGLDGDRRAGGTYAGMANVGPRPTFPDGPPSLEAHLFDFAGDLYGSEVRVRFHAHLRGQRGFGGVDELRAQLERDEAAARSALAELEATRQG